MSRIIEKTAPLFCALILGVVFWLPITELQAQVFATNPSYLSSELTRYYELKDDELILSLDKKRTNQTVWKRAKGAKPS